MLNKYREKLEKEGVVYLLCKIFPGASETKIKEIKNNNIDGKDVEMVYISVSSPAVKNQANKEIVKFLSKQFAVEASSITITIGSTDRTKLIKIKK